MSALVRKMQRELYGEVIYPMAVRLRGEQSVFERLTALQAAQYDAIDVVRRRQSRAVADVLRLAVTHVPRYRRLMSADEINADNAASALRHFPILDKEILQREPETLRASNWLGRYSTKTTGGSTGRPVTVHKNPAAIAQEMAATWMAYGWFGVRVGDRCVRFWGQPARNPRRRLRYLAADTAMHRVTLSAFGYGPDELSRYVKRIRAFQPAYLYGYVSALEDLGRYLLQRHEMLGVDSLKCVITTSEVLTPPQREVLVKAFGVPVQNEYGCGEVGPIAYECPAGALHLLPTNQFIEILREDGRPVEEGEAGQVVLTDLTNRVMPLIRYRVGDNAAFGRACACGRTMPVLGTVFGREYDFVESPDGRRYHGEFFMYLFEDLRRNHPGIGQFQVIQVASDQLLVRLVLDRLDDTAETAACRQLEQRLPSFSVRAERVDRIERQSSGKMRVVENRVHRDLIDQTTAARA